MDAYQLIEKWKLNHGQLASRMGMKKGTFNNKLSPSHPTQFKAAEEMRLREILREMGRDLTAIEPMELYQSPGSGKHIRKQR